MKYKKLKKIFQVKENNKLELKNIVYVALFLIVWILFGFNTYNADYSQYEYSYNLYSQDVHGSTNEIGFKIICTIFKVLGFPYQLFIIVFSFVGLLVLFKSVREYTDNYVLWAVCYCFFPFAFDVPQIRTFAVEVIVVYSLRYLKKYNHHNLLCFLTWMLIAVSIHSLAILYLPLMIAYIKKTRTVASIAGVITAFLLFVSVFANGLVTVAFKMLSFLGTNISGGVTYVVFWPHLRTLMFKYLFIGALIVILNIINRRNVKWMTERESIQLSKILEKITYISMIYIPLMSFGPSFGRLFGRILPILYCGLIQKTAFLKKGTLSFRKIASNYACLGIAVALFYFHIYTGDLNTFERVFKVLFENNMLF